MKRLLTGWNRDHPVALLWGAALTVHLLSVWAAIASGQAAGDVATYGQWAASVLDTGQWPVLTSGWEYSTWVYPVVALVPILTAGLLGKVIGFTAGWYVVAACASLAGTWLAAGRGKRIIGGWYWVLFIGLLGPVALSRIDVIAALTIAAGLTLVARQPQLAAVALTVGAWVKVAPGLVLVPVFAALRGRWRDVVAPAAAVSVAVMAAVAAAGGGLRSLSFLTVQGTRGLQAESPAAAAVLLLNAANPEVSVVYNQDLLTHEIHGSSLATLLATVLTPLLAVAVLVVGILVWRARRHPMEAILWGTVAVLAAAIVFNKVGSPQFHLWLAAPLAIGLATSPTDRRWRTIAALGLADAAATCLVYPLLFGSLVSSGAWGLAALCLRTAAVVTILVLATRGLLLTAREPNRTLVP